MQNHSKHSSSTNSGLTRASSRPPAAGGTPGKWRKFRGFRRRDVAYHGGG